MTVVLGVSGGVVESFVAVDNPGLLVFKTRLTPSKMTFGRDLRQHLLPSDTAAPFKGANIRGTCYAGVLRDSPFQYIPGRSSVSIGNERMMTRSLLDVLPLYSKYPENGLGVPEGG